MRFCVSLKKPYSLWGTGGELNSSLHAAYNVSMQDIKIRGLCLHPSVLLSILILFEMQKWLCRFCLKKKQVCAWCSLSTLLSVLLLQEDNVPEDKCKGIFVTLEHIFGKTQ